MMGHISDRTLDNLLDGSLDDAGEFAIGEHVRRCDRCAGRLREWELLFPQIKNLTHPGEYQVATAEAAPRPPSVYVPDWTPPRAPQALPARLAWGLVLALALGAGYLLLQKTGGGNAVAYLPENYDMASQPASGESAGLGSGVPALPDLEVPPVATPEPEPVLGELEQPIRETPLPEPPGRESAEQDVRAPSPNREAPVSFPMRLDTAATRSARVDSPARGAADSEMAAPLPRQFQRVTLGEAIGRLNGTVRLIDGLNPETVEIALGSVLPGADPEKAVVRVVYNAPEGRLILDQQRLGRSGNREPAIAINTAPSGVSVAQWVDRGGFWISLAGRADQQTLLAIANRIR